MKTKTVQFALIITMLFAGFAVNASPTHAASNGQQIKIDVCDFLGDGTIIPHHTYVSIKGRNQNGQQSQWSNSIWYGCEHVTKDYWWVGMVEVHMSDTDLFGSVIARQICVYIPKQGDGMFEISKSNLVKC